MTKYLLILVCAMSLGASVIFATPPPQFTCGMHPDVVMDHPGNCPKCGMKLVPVRRKKTSNAQRPTSNAELRSSTRNGNGVAGSPARRTRRNGDGIVGQRRGSDVARRVGDIVAARFFSRVWPHAHVGRGHADVARRNFSALHQRQHPTRRRSDRRAELDHGDVFASAWRRARNSARA